MPQRVYIEDTDAGGIVFYANYLRYMERARTEWLRTMGIELDEWQNQHRRLFVVKSVQVEFLMPAKFNDQLTIYANLLTHKFASLSLEQPVMRVNETVVNARVRLACVDADTLKPCKIPLPILEAISSER